MSRYHTIFQGAPDGILLVDAAGTIVEVNDRAVELFGWTREELEGSSVDRLVPAAARGDHEAHRREFAEHPHSRPMGVGMQLRALRKDGTEFPVEISLAPLETGDDGPLVVATVRDVTERMRLRDFGAAALRAAEDERRRISRDLHDDTAQSLATLLIRLRLAEAEASDATRRTLEEIRDELTHAAEGIRRIARGLRPPELEDAGLAAALRAHGRSVREATGLDVEMELETVGGHLDTDAQLVLYRVVQEALSNAVRHGRPERLGVRLQKEGKLVAAEIWDDGKGFDVEAERRSGGGLGLMGMLERAASVNGHVELRSTPGEGTTVRLLLPTRDRGASRG